MPDRPLPAEDRALWARIAATVTPLAGGVDPVPIRFELVGNPPQVPRPAPVLDRIGPDVTLRRKAAAGRKVPPPTDTLDGGWDRRLRRGAVVPDRSIDLHGHTLATAQAALDGALDRAVADEVRVLLVVTGKPPRERDGRRGLIRASIFDWLGHSRYGSHIAAVRNAHPRHGGMGALYLILRRKRGG